MYKTRVGVLRGGPSAEYEVSLKTGQSVLEHLPKDVYDVKDVLIDRNGGWYLRGLPVSPSRILGQIDVAFIALHGKYGEDGDLQRMLDTYAVRYTGSDALSSAIAMNKGMAKKCLRDATYYKHPYHKTLSKETLSKDVVFELFRTFPQPSVIKPINGGSSIGTTLVTSFDELLYALTLAFAHAEQVLVEQYIKGREVTVAVADDFRGEKLYAFPPVEITTSKNSFFDYNEKYGGGAKEVCPARFPYEVTKQLLSAAKHVHQTIGLRDYSRSDFIVASNGVYFLEVNSLPGLTSTSLVPKAVGAMGATLPQFLTHLVERAKSR